MGRAKDLQPVQQGHAPQQLAEKKVKQKRETKKKDGHKNKRGHKTINKATQAAQLSSTRANP